MPCEEVAVVGVARRWRCCCWDQWSLSAWALESAVTPRSCAAKANGDTEAAERRAEGEGGGGRPMLAEEQAEERESRWMRGLTTRRGPKKSTSGSSSSSSSPPPPSLSLRTPFPTEGV